MNKTTFKGYSFVLRAALCMLVSTGLAGKLHAQGFLHADGKRIVNEQGKEVLLRGIGLGGWMLQEGYMLKINGGGQQHVIKKRIADVIGKAKTDEFYRQWLSNHTQKADIDSLHAWGFNSVRLPMHYNLYTLPVEKEPSAGVNTWLQTGFDMTDSLLAWCKANNMYLILDLHAAPGGQGNDLNIADRDTAQPSLWASEENRKKTVALWRQLASRYANEPNIGGYDILNEPNFGFDDPEKDKNGLSEQHNAPLKKLYIDIINAIREVDKRHIIIIEGNGWGNNYNGLLPPWDKNMVLSFHKYWNYNDEESIKKIVTFRQVFNVPVWLGETGENSNVWFTQAIDLLEKNNIGWAWWPLKKIGFNNPLEVKAPAGYENLLQYWSGKGAKPDSVTAYKSLMQLAANLKIENNIYHKDVIDAMFRQPHTDKTLPFKNNRVATGTTVKAVDYDLGKNGFAYYDADTANYRVSGKPGEGNKGRSYRNDGVDIKQGTMGNYFVSDIETGEWLQYTVNNAKASSYDIEVETGGNGGEMEIQINDTRAGVINIPASTGDTWQTSKLKNVALPAGSFTIKCVALKGGYTFKAIRFAQPVK